MIKRLSIHIMVAKKAGGNVPLPDAI